MFEEFGMSSIVTHILCSMTRLLLNRPNCFNAAELKDGDSADKIRQMVVRELDETRHNIVVQTKIFALASFS